MDNRKPIRQYPEGRQGLLDEIADLKQQVSSLQLGHRIDSRVLAQQKAELTVLRKVAGEAVSKVRHMRDTIGCICDDDTQCGCGFFETGSSLQHWQRCLEDNDADE